MELGDLIDQTRKQAADAVAQPGLWSDDDITLYLNEAIADACRRAKLIRDQVTDAITLLTLATTAVTPSTPTGVQYMYNLDPSIFQIDSAIYVDTQVPILEVSKDLYERHRWHHRYGYGYGSPGMFGDYNTASAGRATGYWPDTLPNSAIQMRLLPLPTATTYVDATNTTQPIQIRLCVYRTPLESEELEVESDEPIIDRRYHLKLIDGACARMYMRNDIDSFNADKAAMFEKKFTASFGDDVSANTIRQRREYRRGRTTFRFPG